MYGQVLQAKRLCTADSSTTRMLPQVGQKYNIITAASGKVHKSKQKHVSRSHTHTQTDARAALKYAGSLNFNSVLFAVYSLAILDTPRLGYRRRRCRRCRRYCRKGRVWQSIRRSAIRKDNRQLVRLEPQDSGSVSTVLTAIVSLGS